MNPERWEQVGRLYQAALEVAVEGRSAFLCKVCGDDQELRQEVESLLAAEGDSNHFLSGGAMNDAAKMLAADRSPSLVGKELGRCRLLSRLGSGGMGEVYLAEDSRLKRKVAIKLLPAELTANPDRVRRFEQEARAASALNHPNIIIIHEIGEIDNTQYLVTEFIEGETLRECLGRGPMEVTKGLEVIVQVASALAAAHEAGIVHRDIKPENIMLRLDGLVKVLDFGLAKLTDLPATGGESNVPKLNTETGIVMGTVRYMSPEQARGQRVDARSDIFSLGVVLYEMLAGHSPFEGETQSHIIVSILEHEPPSLAMRAPDTPAELLRIVRKTLTKHVDERYQTARDLLIDLKNLRRELEVRSEIERLTRSEHQTLSANIAQSRQGPTSKGILQSLPSSGGERSIDVIKRYRRGIALAISVVAIAGVAFWLYRDINQKQSQSNRPGPSLRIVPITSFGGQKNMPAFSPDGNQVAFLWDGGKGDSFNLYVKLIDAGTPLQLATNVIGKPAWSPDGGQIAFMRPSSGQSTPRLVTETNVTDIEVYLVPSLGGRERKLTEVHQTLILNLSLDWSPDGKSLAVADTSLPEGQQNIFLIAAESGEKERVESPPYAKYLRDTAPSFSPDGKTLAFLRGPSFFVNDVYVVPVGGGEPTRITFDSRWIRGLDWTADGREIIFSSNRGGLFSMWQVPLSGGRPEALPAVGEDAYLPTISRRGNRLAYLRWKPDSNIWRTTGPAAPARAGSAVKLISSTRPNSSPQYSPDGKQIVFASWRSGNSDIWVCDSDGSNPLQLTSFNGSASGTPRWSPDGQRVAFDCRLEGHADIFVISAEGGKPRRVTTELSEDVVPSWSRDGSWIYFSSDRSGNSEVWKVPAEGGEAMQVTKQGGFEPFQSSDRNFIYYTKSSSIWRIPAEGGEEIRILDHIDWGYWALLDLGICFLNRRATPRPAIELFNFATGRIERITTVEIEPNAPGEPGFSISPDGRWIIYKRVDQIDSDIMLVENFR